MAQFRKLTMSLVLFIFLLFSAAVAQAQEITVQGTVTDAQTGKPVVGVNILVAGTSTGTTTDIDGHYSLTVSSQQDTLRFSYIGYKAKTVPINGRTTINVAMEPTVITGEELVVVGYGKKRESEITGSVAAIEGSVIEETAAVNLSNSLAGRVPGLYVNQTSAIPGFDDPQIVVRGFNTYTSSSPLIVIDGVPQADPAGLSRLNPHNIESISVLKGANAAIYGSRASGGVILVTTKRGRVGNPVFRYTGSYGIQTPTMKPRMADALPYMHIVNSWRKLEDLPLYFNKETIKAYKSGKRKSTDWWNAIIDPPIPVTRHSLSISGGSDMIQYYTAIGMVAQMGGLIEGDSKTQNQQYSLRSNLDFTLSDRLTAKINFFVRQKETHSPPFSPGGVLGYARSTSPLEVAFINGNHKYPASGFSQLNPLARINSKGLEQITHDLINVQLEAKYEIPGIDGLTLGGSASFIKNTNRIKNFRWLWHFYRDTKDRGIIRIQSRNPGHSQRLRLDQSRNRRITLNARIEYETTINKYHNVNAFVQGVQMSYQGRSFWAARYYFPTPEIPFLSAGTQNKKRWGNSSSGAHAFRRSLVSRISYNFKEKYLFSFNFRFDGSYIFPNGSRWGFFPGISAGWLISKEPFLPDVFSTLKLRASWGETGNDRVPAYQFIRRFNYTPGIVFGGGTQRGITSTVAPNPNITWAVTTKANVGLDIGLFENKLNFKIDLYRSFTRDILAENRAVVPLYTGLVLPDQNIGKMKNHGFEFQVSYRKFFSNNLSFNIGANISYNENEIVKIPEPPLPEQYQSREGHALGAILVYKAIGIYRTKEDFKKYVSYPNASLGTLIFADLNGDGEIDSDDKYRFEASGFSNAQFGLHLGMNYKNFSINVLFQGQAGGKWRLSNFFSGTGSGNGLAYVANHSYTMENTDSELPRIHAVGIGAADSDFWYFDASWLRLKSLNVSYSLPTKWTSNIGVSRVRMFFSGRNLWMAYNSLKEFGAGDPAFTPNLATYKIGLNIKF